MYKVAYCRFTVDLVGEDLTRLVVVKPNSLNIRHLHLTDRPWLQVP